MFRSFGFCKFEFVSDFDIRISNLIVSLLSPAPYVFVVDFLHNLQAINPLWLCHLPPRGRAELFDSVGAGRLESSASASVRGWPEK